VGSLMEVECVLSPLLIQGQKLLPEGLHKFVNGAECTRAC